MPNIIILGQVEHLPDLGGALRTALTRLLLISKARHILLTLLHDNQVQDRQIGRYNAAADRFPAAFTIAAAVAAEARVSWGHQYLDTTWGKHTLLHRKALLVLTTHDLENISLEFLQNRPYIDAWK